MAQKTSANRSPNYRHNSHTPLALTQYSSTPPPTISLQERTASAINSFDREIPASIDTNTEKLIGIRDTLIDLTVDTDKSRVDAVTAKVQLEGTQRELERLTRTSQSRKIIPDPRVGKSALCTGEYIQVEKRRRAEKEEREEFKKTQTMTGRGRERERGRGRGRRSTRGGHEEAKEISQNGSHALGYTKVRKEVFEKVDSEGFTQNLETRSGGGSQDLERLVEPEHYSVERTLEVE
ncbi:hypothetical protein HOY80DRAFT_1115964 [Tuber brumale]|nr:hypothetical protein HOY80DRAFT_1115964 [Tuber brumale]